MKKLIHFLLVIALLSTTQFAQASGRNKHIRPTDPAPQDSSSVRASFIGGPHTNLGGEVILTVTVLDLTAHPVAGALVSAKCTGLADMYTNTQGVVQFKVGSVCPCNSDPVIVTTQKGCYQAFNASCGKYSVTCNQ